MRYWRWPGQKEPPDLLKHRIQSTVTGGKSRERERIICAAAAQLRLFAVVLLLFLFVIQIGACPAHSSCQERHNGTDPAISPVYLAPLRACQDVLCCAQNDNGRSASNGSALSQAVKRDLRVVHLQPLSVQQGVVNTSSVENPPTNVPSSLVVESQEGEDNDNIQKRSAVAHLQLNSKPRAKGKKHHSPENQHGKHSQSRNKESHSGKTGKTPGKEEEFPHQKKPSSGKGGYSGTSQVGKHNQKDAPSIDPHHVSSHARGKVEVGSRSNLGEASKQGSHEHPNQHQQHHKRPHPGGHSPPSSGVTHGKHAHHKPAHKEDFRHENSHRVQNHQLKKDPYRKSSQDQGHQHDLHNPAHHTDKHPANTRGGAHHGKPDHKFHRPPGGHHQIHHMPTHHHHSTNPSHHHSTHHRHPYHHYELPHHHTTKHPQHTEHKAPKDSSARPVLTTSNGLRSSLTPPRPTTLPGAANMSGAASSLSRGSVVTVSSGSAVKNSITSNNLPTSRTAAPMSPQINATSMADTASVGPISVVTEQNGVIGTRVTTTDALKQSSPDNGVKEAKNGGAAQTTGKDTPLDGKTSLGNSAKEADSSGGTAQATGKSSASNGASSNSNANGVPVGTNRTTSDPGGSVHSSLHNGTVEVPDANSSAKGARPLPDITNASSSSRGGSPVKSAEAPTPNANSNVNSATANPNSNESASSLTSTTSDKSKSGSKPMTSSKADNAGSLPKDNGVIADGNGTTSTVKADAEKGRPSNTDGMPVSVPDSGSQPQRGAESPSMQPLSEKKTDSSSGRVDGPGNGNAANGKDHRPTLDTSSSTESQENDPAASEDSNTNADAGSDLSSSIELEPTAQKPATDESSIPASPVPDSDEQAAAIKDPDAEVSTPLALSSGDGDIDPATFPEIDLAPDNNSMADNNVEAATPVASLEDVPREADTQAEGADAVEPAEAESGIDVGGETAVEPAEGENTALTEADVDAGEEAEAEAEDPGEAGIDGAEPDEDATPVVEPVDAPSETTDAAMEPPNPDVSLDMDQEDLVDVPPPEVPNEIDLDPIPDDESGSVNSEEPPALSDEPSLPLACPALDPAASLDAATLIFVAGAFAHDDALVACAAADGLAAITPDNEEAAFALTGGNGAWIASWSGDDYSGSCLALLGEGSVGIPANGCDDLLGALCQTKARPVPTCPLLAPPSEPQAVNEAAAEVDEPVGQIAEEPPSAVDVEDEADAEGAADNDEDEAEPEPEPEGEEDAEEEEAAGDEGGEEDPGENEDE